ncbi:MAG TPA: Ppx/GppA phosphatase family protein [Mycobacteriales bacterium]|nr:Ppx/GppA phosphatase family protein [Mycobacteriales bacterium]
MTRVAALDCGTNSLRLLVADVDDGALTDVHRELRVVRLGEGVDRTGVLAPQALQRVRAALVDYAATCRSLGVERTRMVATSATRDARNRSEFTALVREALGTEPEVISGEEEAALSFDGATRGLDAAEGPFLVVDIGGGSTEVVLGTTEVEAAVSVDLGCVRLTERHLRDDPPSAAQVAAARHDVDEALERVRDAVPVDRARLLVALAGTATTVAAHALRLPAYLTERTHLARLDAGTVVAACDDLLAMSRADRAALPYMHPGRVDVIGAGALVLRGVVQEAEASQVLVSEADILDGTAWSLA